MPDDGYEYLLITKDEWTSPMKKAADATDSMDRALQRIDQSLRYMAEHSKVAQNSIVGMGAAAKHASTGAHGLASGISYAVRGFDDLSRGGGYAANGLLDVGKAFARLGPYLAGAALLGGVAAIAKYSFEMSELKEQTVDAYSVFQGSAEKGAGLFSAVDDLAESTHAPAAKLQAKTQELLELGLTNQTQLTQTVRAITDLQRVGLEGGAKKLESIVERSLAAGHLVLGRGGAGASRALTGTGIDEKGLAAQLGLSPKRLEADLKAGRISVEQGIAALDQSIISGKVGALATKRFTVSDAFTDLHNSVRKLLQEADDSPINDAMHRLTQSFADSTDGAKQLSEAASFIFEGIGHAIDGVVTFGSTVNTVFDEVWNKIDWVGDKWATLGKSEAETKEILRQRHITRATQELGGAVGNQEEAFAKVQDLARSGASESEIKATASRLGIDVSVQKPGTAVRGAREPTAISREVPGLQVDTQSFGAGGTRGAVDVGNVTYKKGGITPDTPEDVLSPLRDLGANAAEAMHDGAAGPRGFDAHSPSRKMFELGMDVAEGFQGGAAAAASLYAPDEGRADPRSSPGRSAPSVKVDVGGLHFQGHLDLEDFGPLLESMVADVFERAALELGQ